MRTELVGVAMAILMLAGVRGADAAKRCRLLCRDQVRACVADARTTIVCTDLRGHDRRDCQRALHADLRACKSNRGPILSACRTAVNPDACSPSGAFVDAPVRSEGR
jgi:hypothetical protein